MPSTLDIRRRIRSIKSTKQITKAMEMVSAAKMRRAQGAALAARTYSRLAWDLLTRVAGKANPELHRLVRRPQQAERAAILLITSNRGLIGGFNNNIISAALERTGVFREPHFITLGKKGRDAAAKRGLGIVADFPKLDVVADVAEILPLARMLVDDFVSEKYDQVVMVYGDFISTLQQKPKVQELLPFVRPESATEIDYLFEPTPDEVLEVLLPRLVTIQVYQALLETNAAEHSARMVTMKNASDAASDLVSELTLDYNRIRQAAITKEISEIVAGSLAIQ